MCDVMKKYEDIAAEKAAREERLRNLSEMISNGGTDEELRKFHNASDEEIKKAREALVIA